MNEQGDAGTKPTKGRRKWKRTPESIEKQKATMAARKRMKEKESENMGEKVQEAVILLRKAYKEIRERGEWHEGDLYTVLALRALGG